MSKEEYFRSRFKIPSWRIHLLFFSIGLGSIHTFPGLPLFRLTLLIFFPLDLFILELLLMGRIRFFR